jgi:hypothetical protein
VSEFVFREVSLNNWSDFADLFESRGGPKRCWCMVWSSAATNAKQRDGASRRAAMQSKVEAGVPIGISATATAPLSPGVRSRLGTLTAISGALMIQNARTSLGVGLLLR